jgi:hypothetical protein
MFCATCEHPEIVHAEDGNRDCVYSVCDCNRFVVGARLDPSARSPLPGIRARSPEGWGTDARSGPQPSGLRSWVVVRGSGLPSVGQVEDDPMTAHEICTEPSGDAATQTVGTMSTPFDALVLARAIGRGDTEAVDLLLDDLGIPSSEKATSLVGHLCGLLIGLARLHAARSGESWEDLLTKLVTVAVTE